MQVHKGKTLNKKLSLEDDFEEDEILHEKYLSFACSQQVSNTITVAIDEPIRDSNYYRYVAQAIEALTEDDFVRFEIASPGGLLSGLETLLSALVKTDAISIACINSNCHSAASILALNCDEILVTPYASMLVHYVTFGVSGPSNHVFKHSTHLQKISERLFRETYQGFLTDAEIASCINDDLQIWLDADQIIERLEARSLYLQEKSSEDCQEEDSCGNSSSCCGNCHS